jgi:signal transduction histidine kinase
MQSERTAPRSRGLIAAAAITFSISVAALFLIPQALSRIFSTQFLPHVYCYLYDKKLIALHVGSDAAIWLSYVAISVTLTYLVYRTRREMPFSWMFLAFGTFIIACGFTHLMEVIVLWKPLYWLSGDVKLLTAVASVITAAALPPLVPKVHQMVSAAKLSDERQQSVEHTNDELFRANQALEQEIERRNSLEQELRRLSGRLLEIQDDERRRLARELHDSTGQLLAAIQLNLSLAQQDIENKPLDLRHRLSEAATLSKQAINEVRTMSYLLHPPMLDEAGLILALQWYVEGFVERSNLNVDLQLPDKWERLSRELELAIFRLIQESLTNIHRHSASREAVIKLELTPTEVILFVRDFGKGISLIANGHNGGRILTRIGVGIRGMQERVRQLGGSITIKNADPGTSVEVHFPLSNKPHPQTPANPVPANLPK